MILQSNNPPRIPTLSLCRDGVGHCGNIMFSLEPPFVNGQYYKNKFCITLNKSILSLLKFRNSCNLNETTSIKGDIWIMEHCSCDPENCKWPLVGDILSKFRLKGVKVCIDIGINEALKFKNCNDSKKYTFPDAIFIAGEFRAQVHQKLNTSNKYRS